MSLERFERLQNSEPAMNAASLPATKGLFHRFVAGSKKAGVFILKKLIKGALTFAFLYIVIYVFHEMQAQGCFG